MVVWEGKSACVISPDSSVKKLRLPNHDCSLLNLSKVVEMLFKDKTIFIISYESWGKMLMSKHHYALELARKGNQVYFINHPDKKKSLKRGEVVVEPTGYNRLFVVKHRLFHPYFLKFKWRSIYNFFIRNHIRKIIKTVGKEPDVVWSFDCGNTLPLKYFSGKGKKIFMPVDGPFWHQEELLAADKADIIVSVTPEILDRYKEIETRRLLIGHGVSSAFLNVKPIPRNGGPIRIGYAGSLIRNDLDTKAILRIVSDHPDKIFEFWGENDPQNSNIHAAQDVDPNTITFIDKLKHTSNVILHGAVDAGKLAEGFMTMDAFLVSYNIKNLQNSHKILEYLTTGKVVISNFLSSYASHQDIVAMLKEGADSSELPELFSLVMKEIDDYNSIALQEKRRAFANKFSYHNNVERIEEAF